MIIKFFRRYFLNWVIIMSLMWKSTNEYPKTENYHFNCFLHKILSTVNVTWNSAASVYTLLCDGYPHISFGPITFCEYLLMKTTHVQDAFTETKQNFVLSNVNSTFFMKLLDSIVKYLLVEIFTSKDRETLMHTQNVAKFKQEQNQSRQHCMLKDLLTVSVVQTVPLCYLGSCSLVFVCTCEYLFLPTCVLGYQT